MNIRDEEDSVENALITQALRQYSNESLPPGFAAQTAALVEAPSTADEERVEKWLQRMLVTLLLIAGIATAAIFGSAAVVDWMWVVASCFAVSWVVQHMQRSRTS
jgi:uncharacterized membrane protein YoaK (UPF0700 family)